MARFGLVSFKTVNNKPGRLSRNLEYGSKYELLRGECSYLKITLWTLCSEMWKNYFTSAMNLKFQILSTYLFNN